MFRQAFLCENIGTLYWDERYEIWKWMDGDIFVSLTRKGDAIVCHFYAGKTALRRIREATEDFCRQAFDVMPWCQMIIGCMRLRSVIKVISSCGFWHVHSGKEVHIYARSRPA